MQLGFRLSEGTASRAWVLVLALCVFSALPVLAQLQGGSSYPIDGVENPPVSFQSITTAVTYLAANGVTGTGEVILELSPGYAGEPGYIIIPAIPGTSETLRVTFRPAAGYTALTSIPGAASPNYVAIRVLASYITFDGQAGGTGGTRDWTIRCTGTGSSGLGNSAIRFGQSTPTAAQTDMTVRYCILEGEAANTTSAIVGVDGGATYTMKNLVIANNLIRSTGVTNTNCRGYGITIANATNAGNTGLVVRDNVIRDVFARGINYTGGFPGGLVYNNDIAHTAAVTMASTTEFSGIYFSATSSQGTRICGNFIHDIQLANGTTAANGIYLYNGNSSGERVKVYNNRVAIGAGIAPTTFPIYGIRDNSLSGVLFDVDYNSVYLSGEPAAGTANSAAFRKDLSNYLNIRNNVFFNARSNTGTATGTHWAISVNNTTFTSINNNDYWVSGVGGVLGTISNSTAGNKTTLAAWKASVPADGASVSQDPHYLAPTAVPPDLHLDATIQTQLESGGQALAGIDDDFEGEIRYGSPGYGGTGTAPDIGADEFEGILLDLSPPVIAYTLIPNNTATTTYDFGDVVVTDASGVDGAAGTRPRVYYKRIADANAWNDNTSATDGWKYVEANGATSPFDFTLDYSLINGGTVVVGDILQYFVVAQDLSATPNVGINAGSFAAAPASVDLQAAQFPIGGTLNSYTVVGTIAGAFTVGTGGDYGTLKEAFDAINLNVVNGDVTLTVLASGTTETASAVLNAAAYEDGPWEIRIVPEAGAAPVITGSIAGALIKLNGADHVTIDGSGATRSRDLTIQNTSTAGGTAAIWLSSLGTGQGCHHVTVEDCVVLCGVDQSASTSESFAIITSGTSISTSSWGADNDDNRFLGNEVRKARWGIYILGISGNPNDRVEMRRNLVGPADWGSEQMGKGGITARYVNEAAITDNEVRYVGVLYSQTAGGSDRAGVGLGGDIWTPTATTATASVVTGNLIHHIVEEKTFSAAGLIVAGTGTPSGNLVANNVIYEVRANGTSPDQGVGIGIAAGDGDRVVFNSIRMEGDQDPAGTTATQSTCGVRISSATAVTNLTLKNNAVYVDVSSNTTTLNHYAIVAPSASLAWGTGGCDHNDYYIGTGNAQMSLGGLGTSVPYTAVPTLAGWRAVFTPPQDGASLDQDPLYVGPADLHVDTSGIPVSPLADAGVAIGGVAVDFDGEARGVTPDIGADEFVSFSLVVSVEGSGTVTIDPDQPLYNPGTSVELTAAVLRGWAFDHWSGDASGSDNPLTVVMDADKSITAHFVFTAPALTIQDATVTEGDRIDSFFDVFLSEPLPELVMVHYTTVDGTALAGADYAAIADTLFFAPGDTVETIVVGVLPDLLDEDDEVFTVELSAPFGAVLADSVAVGTILDDDPLPLLAVGDVTVTEGDAGAVAAVFSVALSAPSGRVLNTTYQTTDDTAVAGEDYTALPPTPLAFAPGDPLVKTVTVQVLGDTDDEPDETFFLNLTLPVNVLLADSVGVGTILDDDDMQGVAERIPSETFLGGGFPNPVGASATILFGLKSPGEVELRILDLQGRVVRELVRGALPASYQRVVWDGRDNAARPVGAGCYFVHLRTPERTFEQRILVVR